MINCLDVLFCFPLVVSTFDYRLLLRYSFRFDSIQFDSIQFNSIRWHAIEYCVPSYTSSTNKTNSPQVSLLREPLLSFFVTTTRIQQRLYSQLLIVLCFRGETPLSPQDNTCDDDTCQKDNKYKTRDVAVLMIRIDRMLLVRFAPQESCNLGGRWCESSEVSEVSWTFQSESRRPGFLRIDLIFKSETANKSSQAYVMKFRLGVYDVRYAVLVPTLTMQIALETTRSHPSRRLVLATSTKHCFYPASGCPVITDQASTDVNSKSRGSTEPANGIEIAAKSIF